ncbi:MAG: hypothetical protein KBD19_04945 [Candidatus Moranbacteria bacterium]|nr:hypothetical protein [Candidatus Moranbacteria bacterium]
MNVEQWGGDGVNEAVERATAPVSEHDYSGRSLRIDGEDIAETILREFKADPEDPRAVQAAMRAEKDTIRKARLSNLYRKWQEERLGEDSEPGAE